MTATTPDPDWAATYDDLHAEWRCVFTGFDIVLRDDQNPDLGWRHATGPELDSIALLAANRDRRRPDASLRAELAAWLDTQVEAADKRLAEAERNNRDETAIRERERGETLRDVRIMFAYGSEED